ncbi:MAG: dTMP kinase [Candidatus Omnitrophica bacterium]|nr:dTMP kinase [Candidatus Omnitrophota bacterium]
MKGSFITFEGIEGSGKSTQIMRLEHELREQGKEVMLLREPGGVKISEKIREILLDNAHTEMGGRCETLLYMAARAQLVAEVLQPALSSGKIVLCDRFLDSTIVYQGYGVGVNINDILAIGLFATQNIQPDLTVLLDVDVAQGLSRIVQKKDRIEARDHSYHQKVREGYLALAKKFPGRIKVVKGEAPVEDIHQSVMIYVKQCLDQSHERH